MRRDDAIPNHHLNLTTCLNAASSGFNGVGCDTLMVYTGLRSEYLPVKLSRHDTWFAASME